MAQRERIDEFHGIAAPYLNSNLVIFEALDYRDWLHFMKSSNSRVRSLSLSGLLAADWLHLTKSWNSRLRSPSLSCLVRAAATDSSAPSKRFHPEMVAARLVSSHFG
jgi:hypothetical protein